MKPQIAKIAGREWQAFKDDLNFLVTHGTPTARRQAERRVVQQDQLMAENPPKGFKIIFPYMQPLTDCSPNDMYYTVTPTLKNFIRCVHQNIKPIVRSHQLARNCKYKST
jgi:hypothetical protein